MLDTPVLPGNLELAKLLAKNDFEVTAAQQEFRILDIDLDSQLLKNFVMEYRLVFQFIRMHAVTRNILKKNKLSCVENRVKNFKNQGKSIMPGADMILSVNRFCLLFSRFRSIII